MPSEINFYADESVERRIVIALREKYNVVSVDETMKGAADALVLQHSTASETILITADEDFGELVHNRLQVHSGIILYRFTVYPLRRKFQ